MSKFSNAQSPSDLLLAAPVLAVGEAVVLTPGLFFGLDDAVFLKLNQAAVRIPCLSAGRKNRDTGYDTKYVHVLLVISQ